MELDKHISDLLYRYPCVTVPGFGAFITEIVAAHVIDSAFFPPKKSIQFNPNIKNNDGLLVNHVAMQQKIAFDLAVEKVTDTTNQWLQLLQNRRKLQLQNIGNLYLNNENNIVFEPIETVNYLTASFGLHPFVSPVIKRNEIQSEIAVLEKELEIIQINERKIGYSYLKYAAVAAVLLSMSALAYKNYSEEQFEANQLLVEQKVQQKITKRIQEATFFIPTPVKKEVVAQKVQIATETAHYHIVAGAFRSEENAENAILELNNAGFEKAKMLPKNKEGLYPVVYESFSSLKEAETEQKFIQSIHNSEAWLLIN
jgi:hypothetical protein